MPKTNQIGPKPVDNGQLGGNPSAPGLGWGVTPTGGGGGIGWGSVSPSGTASQIGSGSMGGLQSLFSGGAQGTPGLGSINGGGLGASGYAGSSGGDYSSVGNGHGGDFGMPPPGGSGGQYPQSWVDTYSRQTPGTQDAMRNRWSGMTPAAITQDWNQNIQPNYGAGTTPDQILGGAPTWQQQNGGVQQGMGYGLAPAPARAGFKLGNRGAAKSMGGSPYAALRTAPTEGGQPPAPPPGITSDPGPAGGGLQSLLERARGISRARGMMI